jgi:hypothetical protein
VDRYHRLPAALRRLVSSALGLAGPKWRKYTALAELPLEERYLGVSFYDRATKEKLVAPELAARVDGQALPALLRPWYGRTAGLEEWHRRFIEPPRAAAEEPPIGAALESLDAEEVGRCPRPSRPTSSASSS